MTVNDGISFGLCQSLTNTATPLCRYGNTRRRLWHTPQSMMNAISASKSHFPRFPSFTFHSMEG